ncbi:H-NS histone family protein [Rhodobacteraceae bacterium G21628-S1]|nr:H-NS histone family protein [Rhodobacteraceae bacterium G21628-S1]
MDIDLKQYSRSELLELTKQIDETMENKLKQNMKNALAEMVEVAKKHDVPFADVIEFYERKNRKKPAQVGLTYTNPNDPSQTWTGKGRRPAWVLEMLREGMTYDDMLT